ncbi:hypothetical protein CR513_24151, partial [Mucuna pruriens]
MDMNMIATTSDGALMDKTPTVASCLISIQSLASTSLTSLLKTESNSTHAKSKQVEAESDFRQSTNQFLPPHSPLVELKPLPDHLKYAYLDDH